MARKFQRKIEDFICSNCGFAVTGDGYTNHCSKCLWSRHVDINPGDREETCLGMMEPIFAEKNKKGYAVIQKCKVCGLEKRNLLSKDDSFDVFLEISKRASAEK